MTPQEHILTWIENSREHNDRLREIYRRRQPGCRDGFMRSQGVAAAASNLAIDTYSDMKRGGDVRSDDEYSPAEILGAAVLILNWEPEA